MKIKNITLGCDPEIFLKDINNGSYVASCGKFGGTKDEPMPISELGHSIQEDNVAIEFNIPPAPDADSYVKDIQFVLNYIKTDAMSKGMELAIESSATFEDAELEHPNAKEFGCEPDFNAWLRKVNTPPDAGANLRTCGGHIHIGYDGANLETNILIIKTMDLFLGLPSLFIDQDVDRRSMYGKAGCFRNKEFGVEYRVLSNFWIKSEELIRWAYNSTIEAINFLNSNNEISEEDCTLIQEAINTSDLKKAEKVLNKFNIKIPQKELELKNA